MAKKKKNKKVDPSKAFQQQLIESFLEFKKIKSMDRPTTLRILEDVFRTLIRKKYGSDDNFNIIVNTSEGDLEIWRKREIVPDGEVEDSRYQIALKEALTIEEEYEVGEECYERVGINFFGRRAIMAARQTLISRVLELEKDKVYKMYIDRVGDIIIGEVYQALRRELVIIDDETKAELLLPRSEMIKSDFFKKGDPIKAVISKVAMKNNIPSVILSRTDNIFLEKLLNQEVPEIEDGLIRIHKIVRIPGERSKVAVESYDERIDPVGACVGMKGFRIHGIVRELKNENIDIINYTTNHSLYVQRALTPARVNHVEIKEEEKQASAYLEPSEIPKAIGRRGINIRLASELTDFNINVFKDLEEDKLDIDLDEFKDEIEDWVIDDLKRIGCYTALSVLNLAVDDLLRRTELEKETILAVRQVLDSEFSADEEE